MSDTQAKLSNFMIHTRTTDEQMVGDHSQIQELINRYYVLERYDTIPIEHLRKFQNSLPILCKYKGYLDSLFICHC